MKKIRLSDGKGRGYSGLARVFTILALMLFVSMGAWAQNTYKVTLNDGGVDSNNWTIAPEAAKTTGVEEDQTVTVTYTGEREVKSIQVKMEATVITAPTAEEGIKAGENKPLVSGGSFSGGTMMMYAVTNDDSQPAKADFSATVPTAVGRTAGTYYVWYYVQGDASHIDSEIAGPVPVTVIKPAATVTTPPSAKTDFKAGENKVIISAGTASGGTMYYKVTTDNSKPTSTDGFSSSVPTAVGRTAGTSCYVWYYVQGDASHIDSEIAGPVTVTIPKSLTVTNTQAGISVTFYYDQGQTFNQAYNKYFSLNDGTNYPLLSNRWRIINDLISPYPNSGTQKLQKPINNIQFDTVKSYETIDSSAGYVWK